MQFTLVPIQEFVTVYTIGHSTHSAAEFVQILQAFAIQTLVDIRTVPRSRKNPQFEQDALRQTLEQVGIVYLYRKALGGLRHPGKNSANTAWRNASFRGYADYMQSPEFTAAIGELAEIARSSTTAIMCAEAVPWRCHRSLVGDALLVRGAKVEDVYSLTSAKPHKLTPWAHVEGMQITYPGA